MTTTTAATSPAKRGSSRTRRARGGFTLVEVLIASSLSLVILAAVLSTFLFIGKGSMRLAHYTDMENDARGALHVFGQDARQASAASWTNANTLSLTVNGQTITYAYDASAATFTRKQGSAAASVLVANIKTFSFRAYQITGAELSLSGSLSAVNTAVKMVQVSLDLERNTASAGKTSSQIISSRCVLRNKKLT